MSAHPQAAQLAAAHESAQALRFDEPGYRGPMFEAVTEAIAQRNKQRRPAAIDRLGERWLLHPANRVARKAAS